MRDESIKTKALIQEIKNSLEEEHGRDCSWEEAEKFHSDLERLAVIFHESYEEDHILKVKLMEQPEGFPVKKGGTCLLCGSATSAQNSWYDKYGLKCLPCQDAIKSELVPVSAISDKDSWYSKYDLETYFNLKGADLRKCVREEFLINCCVMNKGKKVHFELFLVSDNEEVLPPKELIESRIKKISRDGKTFFAAEHWYEFADENLMSNLSKFRIVEILPYTFSKPMERDDFLIEVGTINPLFKWKDEVIPAADPKPLREFPASAPISKHTKKGKSR